MKKLVLALLVSSFAPTVMADPLPAHNKMSVLFMLNTERLIVRPSKKTIGKFEIVLPDTTPLTVFSDRPYRMAQEIPGGIKKFVPIYTKSNFLTTPPNVTFYGKRAGATKPVASVVEIGTPYAEGLTTVLPIDQAIGSEIAPAAGSYSNASLVVDDFWGWTGVIAGWSATALACTAGEALTLGLDTAGCVAGVVASTAATVGVSGSN